MELKLYNTLTREKAAFKPLDPARVRMYVCGPTVYDFAHIGNARPVIVFDLLYRLLRHLAKQGVWDGGKGKTEVKYVRNITDVDDKINQRAAERGITIRELTETTYQNFKDDVAALGCLPPDVEPRATDHIEEMKILIERLVKADIAYAANDHVLFHVAAMKDYGKLARRSLDEMMAGARVEVAPYKRDPMDFVLWKPSKEGEPAWDSPAGIKVKGRPGWHIECSAMSWKHLGETFDIHGGGIDLVFPHHENEIAQSRCSFHTDIMAQVWMHNGFLQVEGEKMAKSAGNFITIRQLYDQDSFGRKSWDGPTIRLAMLKTHYRQPIDWTVKRLWEAEDQIVQWSFVHDDIIEPLNNPTLKQTSLGGPHPAVVEALCDDLNTHQAITVLSQLAKEARSNPETLSVFMASLDLLGLRPLRPAGLNLEGAERRDLVEKTEKLVAARNAARKAKDFKKSDEIRDELAKMGVVLKDNKDGTTSWEIAR